MLDNNFMKLKFYKVLLQSLQIIFLPNIIDIDYSYIIVLISVLPMTNFILLLSGYGNLSPNTVASQVLCIFFALFGIPLNLILLNRIGQLMLSGVHLCAFYLDVKFQWQVRDLGILTYLFI